MKFILLTTIVILGGGPNSSQTTAVFDDAESCKKAVHEIIKGNGAQHGEWAGRVITKTEYGVHNYLIQYEARCLPQSSE